jgi:hypothetical protein
MQIYFLRLSNFIICLIPLLFIIGPAAVEIGAFIINIVFIILIFKNKEFNYFKNNFFIFFILFYLLLVISSLLSEDKILSLNTSIFYIRWGIFFLAVNFFLNKNKKLLKIFFYSTILVVLILLIDGYIQYFYDTNILGYKKLVTHRLSGLFRDELIIGSALLKFMSIILSLFFIFRKKIKYKFFFLLFLVFINLLIFLSGERASAILLFLSIFFYLIFIRISLLYKFLLIFLSACLIFIFFNFDTIIKERMIDHTLKQTIKTHKNYEFEKYNYINIFSPQHEKHIVSAYLIFRKNDITHKIFGSGPRMFSKLCLKVENCDVNPINCCATHPHNIFMQFLSELGIAGIMFLIFFYSFIIYKIAKIYFQKTYLIFDNAKLVILLGMFINFFPLTSSGNFFNNRFSFLYYLFFALYLHIVHISKQNGRTRSN